MKRAVIFGARGQDGTLLTEHLARRDYHVLGVDQNATDCSLGESLWPVDILDPESVLAFFQRFAPDEVYYLAAYHHSSESAELLAPATIWKRSFDVQVNGLLNVLEAIRAAAPKSRLFYAASSLIFGEPDGSPQTEADPPAPLCVYGITKTAGMQVCRFYRRHYHAFASVGILYNHESHLRPETFLSRKIVSTAVRIKQGRANELVLGDLSAQSDWGYAPDYVDAMHRMLALPEPDDFIVATGALHRVQDWVEVTFGALGLNWRDYCREDPSLITRKRKPLVGDSGKLRRLTDWCPDTSFEDMIARMLEMEGAVHV